MENPKHVEIAVLGAGLAGIATAYYLCTKHGKNSVLLIDSRQPMSFTTAQSGDNYRNWWPHPTMADLSNYSIDLMEQIACDSSNVLNMSRRGYLLATRSKDVSQIVTEQMAASPDVDILTEQARIRRKFPSFSEDIASVVHIRRAGEMSGQQLGQFMLEKLGEAGGARIKASVVGINVGKTFRIDASTQDGVKQIDADIVVNAAGPFASHVAAMMDIDLPIENVFQQKIAFEDVAAAIPRRMPFSIDLDDVELDWSDEERELLAEDEDMTWLLERIRGGVHCRPDGGDKGKWVKLGWAYNRNISDPQEELANDPYLNPQFPEIVIRAAAKLNPSLSQYVENFPTRCVHYGGYYSMTRENWPLIGPIGVPGAYIAGALSGFGSMAACAVGAICAAWITDSVLPDYAPQLSPLRYDNSVLMNELATASSRGLL